jgi:hypothetical protein
VSDVSQGEGWWLASDGKWYPPSAPSAPAEVPAGYVSAGGNRGPLGRRENIWLLVLWSVLTLGLYGIYWGCTPPARRRGAFYPAPAQPPRMKWISGPKPPIILR